ncbi:MAG: response regulator [Marinilabiliaceae bacterium]|nr:response regulator [Marinilabiliaceae bacterium]
MFRVVSAISLIISLSGIFTNAQNVKYYSSESSMLSNSLINHIIQDSYGYVWVATEDGLNRFDGSDFFVYRTKATDVFHDGSGLNANYIQTMFEDSQKNLWIGTIRGLQRYNRTSDSFETIPIVAIGDTIAAHVTGIVEDNEGQIWIATSGRGVLCYNGSVATHPDNFKAIASLDFISSISFDKNGDLWLVAFKNGVYRCNTKRGAISLIKLTSTSQLNATTSITHCEDGKTFININDEGLYIFDEESERFVPSDITKIYGAVNIFSFASDKENYYIGTEGKGLITHHIRTGKGEVLDYYIPHVDLKKAKVHSILIDRDGNMWLGLFQKGILLVPRQTAHFTTYSYTQGVKNSIGSGSVMSICAQNDGRLWLGIDSDGLYCVDSNGNANHIENANMPSTIMNIYQNGNDLLLASYNKGLLKYNITSGEITSLNEPLKSAHKNYDNRTTSIVKDSRGRIWVGSFGCGVFVYSSDLQHAIAYSSTSERVDYSRNEPVNNWVNCLCTDHNNIWMGTYGGLSCYDIGKESFIAISDTLRNHIGKRVIYSIAADEKNNNLWFATNDGIFCYNQDTMECIHLTEEEGLPSNTNVSVRTDSLGRAWIGTYNGLSCIQINKDQTSHIDNFHYHNGLQGNEFSRDAAIYNASNGRMYFGGTGGVSSFNPYETEADSIDLHLLFTQFFLNGRFAGNCVPESGPIKFSSSEKSFSVGLTTMNFVNPEFVRYMYYLEGFDNGWQETAYGDKQITYTNILHGQYTLHVKANLGGTMSAEKTLDIEIQPLWWQTNWAIVIYLLLFIGVVLLLYYLIQQRKIIHQQLVDQQHLQEIDEAKFQFFFNISHEIRTPLTLILNPVKQMLQNNNMEESAKKNLLIISRNAQRILRLINQLLDIRKIEKGQFAVRSYKTDISKFVENILSSFESVANSKGIETNMSVEMSDRMVEIDTTNFDKVIYNLYSNAFKFTPNKDGIIKTHIYEEKDSEYVIIDITDNGPGVEVEQRSRIFDRFYQVTGRQDAQFLGTGIGLHLTRSIVMLHGGTIAVLDNQENFATGSTFRIRIPRCQPVSGEQFSAKNIQQTDKEAFTNENFSASLYVEQPEMSNSDSKVRSTTNHKILVVDDEVEISQYITEQLQRRYKVTTCSNGKQALDCILNEPFDLVITDVMMPEMDGLTLCKKIKQNLLINHIPVILLTAKHSDADRNMGLLTGADAYIAKPFDMTILLSTIKSILSNRERILSRFANSAPDRAQIRHIEIKSVDEVLMQKVTDYIEQHISDPQMNVETLADHVGMSRVHMHRKLKELTGRSAREFIRTIRLQQAAILLGEKKLNISEVAYALGYTNLSHFSSTFKDFYGASPKEYMEKHLEEESKKKESE